MTNKQTAQEAISEIEKDYLPSSSRDYQEQHCPKRLARIELVKQALSEIARLKEDYKTTQEYLDQFTNDYIKIQDDWNNQINKLKQENKKLKGEVTAFEEEATLCLKENKKLKELLALNCKNHEEEKTRLHECIDTYAREAGDKPDN